MTTFVETKQKRKGKCKTKNKRMELTRVLSSPIEHIIKKSNEANMNDKQLLMYCLTEYDKIINDDTKNHSDYIRSMQEQISEANEDDYVTIGKIFKLILSKSEQSSNIVKFLIKTIPDADFTEVMKGGNHIVNDGGGLCDYIVKKFPETYVRFSGHYNDKTKNTYTKQIIIRKQYMHMKQALYTRTDKQSRGTRSSPLRGIRTRQSGGLNVRRERFHLHCWSRFAPHAVCSV